MARSVIARKKGDSMQAYFFWLKACELLKTPQSVIKVGYEIDGVDGFDDVSVFYDKPIYLTNRFVQSEYFQIKYHAGNRTAFTAASLIDPAFIGAKDHSILSRLLAIYNKNPNAYRNARFCFITTWGINYQDPISELLREHGEIDYDKLLQGGPSSKFGVLRLNWGQSLGVDIDVLKDLLGSLIISAGKYTFEYLRQLVSDELAKVNLKPIKLTSRSSQYEDLIDRLHEAGRTEFSRAEIIDICLQEGLATDGFVHVLEKTDYPSLLSLGRTKVEAELTKSYFSQKYKSTLYVNRAVETQVSTWLKQPSEKSSTAFLILAAAGSGKTNTLAHIAATTVSKTATILLGGPVLTLSELGLWQPLRDLLKLNSSIELSSRTDLREHFRLLLQNNKKKLLLVIDAINEHPEPIRLRNELQIFLGECSDVGIKVLLSCRDYYWDLFKASWWTPFLATKMPVDGVNQVLLNNYTSSEASKAFSLYFGKYNVSATPRGNAVEQFRHPLLLRFFCETYAGQKLGELSDVRLKDLFDMYWKTKLRSIAERSISQGFVEGVDALERQIGDGLRDLALHMLERNSRVLEESIVKSLLNPNSSMATLASPYGRIIDEHIVIEELESYGYDTKINVAFVFEEFMEYAMARGLLHKWRNCDLAKMCAKVAKLTVKYSNFNQIFGVLLYVAIMVKELRNLALWPALISYGSRWQKLVIEAFKKLPEDQIDDTVFQAIIDLLQVNDDFVQIEALELLKFGRLKRTPTDELNDAVGRLVTHKNLAISRRAVMALAYFSPDFSIPFIEAAISKPRSRQEDKAIIVKNALKTLAIFNTKASRRLLCQIIGGFWRIYTISEIVTVLGSSVSEILPLAEDNDILVRVGAIKLLGYTNIPKALTMLTDKIVNQNYSTQTFYKRELPLWSKFITFSRADDVAVEPNFEMDSIKDAIRKLEETLRHNDVDKLWRQKIAVLKKERVFSQLPYDLESISNVYTHFNLVIFIIKSGLELRSDKKWQIVRSFGSNYLNIRAPKKRMINDEMTREDQEELAMLLGLPNVKESGCEFGVNYYHKGYWQEYIYRAWGITPPELGHTDDYD